jgi:hypothetical protein
VHHFAMPLVATLLILISTSVFYENSFLKPLMALTLHLGWTAYLIPTKTASFPMDRA